MARANYPNVLAETLKHEGGWANHPRDPGGATMRGVIQRNYDRYRDEKGLPRRSVREIEDPELQEIYRKWFWEPVKGDALPYGLDLVAFDGGVNSGPRRGIRWLQVGVGATADGKIGPKTIEAARKADVGSIERACASRMSFLRGLSHWDAFGRGWSRRVASVEAAGTRMWVGAAHGRNAIRQALESVVERAPRQAEDERRAGNTQTTATGAGGAGGVTVADLPPVETVAIALVVVVFAALLFLRSRRKARYHEDRREAFAVELEAIK
jgi:lysozyme family protein